MMLKCLNTGVFRHCFSLWCSHWQLGNPFKWYFNSHSATTSPSKPCSSFASCFYCSAEGWVLQLRLSGQCWEVSRVTLWNGSSGRSLLLQPSESTAAPPPVAAPLQSAVQEQDWPATPSWSRCGTASKNLRALQEIWECDILNKLQLHQHPYILLDFLVWVTSSLRLSPSKLWRHPSLTTNRKLARIHLQRWRMFILFSLKNGDNLFCL